ncbi:transmembrane protein 62 [Neodiprion pinetum]|uniref:transmembrane protein 62 n=1 Tax=Neodiprion pinetum TaxID=441929 RepID=UPI001EDF16BF|nr:transmembrane protein 62-like [Neodiprion pinetum]
MLKMRIAKSTVIFLVFVLMLSVFMANVTNLINVDLHATNSTPLYEGLDDAEPQWLPPKKYDISDSPDNLVWFLQISDIHVSIFQDPSRITELKEFCDITVSAIRPAVVLASGDLTDAKAKDKMGSGQIQGEWEHYRKVLEESDVLKKTEWLDVRGNHDNFNVLSLASKENYYLNYSVQGREHPRSYMHQTAVGSEKYTFIAIDACLEPGPRRPFNFVGIFTNTEADSIGKYVQQARAQGGDYIIWFGHYPTSCILAQCSGGIRSILGRYREGLVYLCGHFHTLAGTVPNMYTLQQAGFLELELADWKDNRAYRLAAIDHGQFSFIDIKHRDWPVALITNPKHALYVMPQKENLQSIFESTHIRVLAFSITDLKSVEVQIDNGRWLECRQVKGPLYSVKWNPKEYKSGLHHIQVRVVDNDGREKLTSQPFSLDGTRLSFRILPRMLLMSNISHFFQVLFGTMLILLVVPLSVLRFLHKLCESGKLQRPRIRIKVFQRWIRKLWILSTIDRLFYPLVLYALYLTVGPWSIGEIIENHTGMIFAWGTWVGSSYLPGSFTYAYGFFQLLSFQLPLTLILAHRADQRVYLMEKPSRKPPTILNLLQRHTLLVLLVTMQASMVYFFWLAYGTMAIILGPMRTWSVLLAIVLWYQINVMPEKCFRSAAMVWSSKRPVINNTENEANSEESSSHKQ